MVNFDVVNFDVVNFDMVHFDMVQFLHGSQLMLFNTI